MQCKDIPDRPILAFLARCGRMATWRDHDEDDHEDDPPTVRDAMPEGLPDRLVLAKMRGLIRRGLVDGCGCGCRGDFALTDKGEESLARPIERTSPSGVIVIDWFGAD